MNSVSGLALDFGNRLALDFGLDLMQLVNWQRQCDVRCTPYFSLLYSLYCISNFFWNIQECSLLCVQFLYVVCTVYTCTRYTLQHSVQSLQCTTIPCKPVHWWGNVTCAVPRGSGKHVVCTHVPEHKNLAVAVVWLGSYEGMIRFLWRKKDGVPMQNDWVPMIEDGVPMLLQTEALIDSVPE